MAEYVVVDKAKLNGDLETIGNAIRTQTEKTAKLHFPEELESEILSIVKAKPEQEKTVEITENGTIEVTPDLGKVLSKIIANVNVAGSGGGGGGLKMKYVTFTPTVEEEFHQITLPFAPEKTVMHLLCPRTFGTSQGYDDSDFIKNDMCGVVIGFNIAGYTKNNGESINTRVHNREVMVEHPSYSRLWSAPFSKNGLLGEQFSTSLFGFEAGVEYMYLAIGEE